MVRYSELNLKKLSSSKEISLSPVIENIRFKYEDDHTERLRNIILWLCSNVEEYSNIVVTKKDLCNIIGKHENCNCKEIEEITDNIINKNKFIVEKLCFENYCNDVGTINDLKNKLFKYDRIIDIEEFGKNKFIIMINRKYKRYIKFIE